MKKRFLSILIVAALCVAMLATVVAAELTGVPTLIEGTAEKWIDRLSLTTEDEKKIRGFYDALVEASDNDGTDDYLIEDSYFVNAEGNTIGVDTVSGILTGEYTEEKAAEAVSQKVSDTLAVYSKYIEAAWAAFDRDHPEVFWLSGSVLTSGSYSYSITGTEVTYEINIQFVLKNDDFDIRAEGYRSEAMIKEVITVFDEKTAEIVAQSSTKTVKEKIEAFNEYLTVTNEYNTSADLSNIPHDCREAVSALLGRTGEAGPVCEGYARAFKVLCDKAGIPCVLVDGDAKTSAEDSGTPHMWNYVQVDGAWLAVDVTWNDPKVSGISGAVSGYESKEWLLVYSNTIISEMTFITSHPVKNLVTAGGIEFINGPELSEILRESEPLTITAPEDLFFMYGDVIPLSRFLVDGGSGMGAITYTVTCDDGAAEIVDGDKLKATKAGSIMITAHKASDGIYALVSSKPFKLTIWGASPEVVCEYTDVTEAGKILADINFTLTAKGINGETLTGTFSWVKLIVENGVERKVPVDENEVIELNVCYECELLTDDSNYDNPIMPIIPWCVHDWEYTANEGKIIGECVEELHIGKLYCGQEIYELHYPNDDYSYEGVLNGANPVYYYNGVGKAAFVADSIGNPIENYPIAYLKWNGSEWVAMGENEIPTEIGKYKASITETETTVSIEYEICYLETDAEVIVEREVCTLAELRAPEGFLISRTRDGKYADYITIPTGMRPETAMVTLYLKSIDSAYGEIAEVKVMVSLEVCKDTVGDGDHTCDKCGNTEMLNDHSYGEATCEAPATCTECGATTGEKLVHTDENKDHKCDRACGEESIGTHADSATDSDHVCDYGCGAVLEDCSDANGDYVCDICSVALPKPPAQTTTGTTQTTTGTTQTTAPEMPTAPLKGGCGGAKSAEPMLFGGAVIAILGAAAGKKRKEK